MINRAKKQEIIKTLTDKLKKAKAVIFTDFTGAKVSDLEELRRQLREKNMTYQVVKKSILSRVYPAIEHSGSVAVALGDDEIALAKILSNFKKIKILGGRGLDLATIDQLAKLPSPEELLFKVVYLLKNNLNRLILCLKNIKV